MGYDFFVSDSHSPYLALLAQNRIFDPYKRYICTKLYILISYKTQRKRHYLFLFSDKAIT